VSALGLQGALGSGSRTRTLWAVEAPSCKSSRPTRGRSRSIRYSRRLAAQQFLSSGVPTIVNF
jgi:hypothetical protein